MGCGCENICSKCWACKHIVIGVILLVVALYDDKYVWPLIGILLIVKGLIKLAKPEGCGHCSMPMPTSKKGRK